MSACGRDALTFAETEDEGGPWWRDCEVMILGYVEETATPAFLYSIVEALEDKAMDRARVGMRSLLSLMPEQLAAVRA